MVKGAVFSVQQAFAYSVVEKTPGTVPIFWKHFRKKGTVPGFWKYFTGECCARPHGCAISVPASKQMTKGSFGL
jgi:hypothetical protein